MNSTAKRSENKKIAGKAYFILSLLAIAIFMLSPALALIMGLAGAIIFGNPFPSTTKIITKYLLQFSIIGLGFGMNFTQVIVAGREGFVFTLLTIAAAIGLGFIIGRLLRVDRLISYLVSVGTAICGGSAIAAISQVVEADDNDVSVSIGTVFILNAVALLIFPAIGEAAGLTQEQFGIWAAIAIHDTSSVVGAATSFGNESLMVATTIKLARALWIIPLVIITSIIFRKQSRVSAFPWFIIFFVLASMVNTYLGIPEPVSAKVVMLAKAGFSLTLFLIGAGISIAKIKSVGFRPMLQGILLWVIILFSTLAMVGRY